MITGLQEIDYCFYLQSNNCWFGIKVWITV